MCRDGLNPLLDLMERADPLKCFPDDRRTQTLCADGRRFLQLINADKVFGTHSRACRVAMCNPYEFDFTDANFQNKVRYYKNLGRNWPGGTQVLVREYAAPSAYNGRKDYPSAEHCSLVLDFG